MMTAAASNAQMPMACVHIRRRYPGKPAWVERVRLFGRLELPRQVDTFPPIVHPL